MNTEIIKKRIKELQKSIDLQEKEKQELVELVAKLKVLESDSVHENYSQQLLKG